MDGRGMTRRRYGIRTCLLVIVISPVLIYLGLRLLGAFLITGDPLKAPNAVVPLGGGSAERVKEAVRLMSRYRSSVLILTEPGVVKPGQASGSRYYRQVAMEAGLSPNAILMTSGVQGSTHDEAVAVLKLMEERQLKTVIVVTEPYHTQRARLIFRDVFRGSGRVVRVHPVSNHWYRSDTWFLSAEGWQMTVKEYVKMAGFLLGLNQTLD